jgi:hypothetical protein
MRIFDRSMRPLVCLLIFAAMSANATELFRDDHPDRYSVFESDAKDVIATITRDDVIKKANKWAARFYNDPFIQFGRVEFRMTPTRFWLVTFQHSDTGKSFYAVILPDGAIVEPVIKETL